MNILIAIIFLVIIDARRTRDNRLPINRGPFVPFLPKDSNLLAHLYKILENKKLFTDYDERLVRTEQGWLLGEYRADLRRFLGIPFAAPPVGKLRWQPPQPPLAYPNGLRDATNYGFCCLQPGTGATGFLSKTIMDMRSSSSEDCLFLNVFTPRQSEIPKEGLPVLVFIHGGTFISGSGSVTLYDPSDFVASEKSFIAVTLNYRLGELGYLASKEIRDSTMDGSYGNFGLQDQKFALEWVKKNIGAFGGNPNRTTLMGQSAGAMSANFLMILQSPENQLFHQAIFMSGTSTSLPLRSLEDGMTQKVYDLFAERFACKDIECLRKIDGPSFVSMAKNLNTTFMWGPALDHVVIKEEPKEILMKGRFPKIPTIFGTTLDDGSLFALDVEADDPAEFKTYLDSNYDKKNAETVAKLYPLDSFPSVFRAISAIATDAVFSCPTINQVDTLLKHNFTVFMYRFDNRQFLSNVLSKLTVGKKLGAFHTSDLSFVFAARFLALTFIEKEIAKNIQRYIGQFTVHGDPNIQGQKPWPKYESTDCIMIFDKPTSVSHPLRIEECHYWGSVPPVIPRSFISELVFPNETYYY